MAYKSARAYTWGVFLEGEAVNFLVFSDDWGEHPSSCQHLFGIIAQQHPTIWVNTVGLRLPQLTLLDTIKGIKKVSAMLGLRVTHKTNGHNGTAPQVTVPLMTPFHHPPWLATFNRKSVSSAVRRTLQKHGFDKYTLVTTTPSICSVIDELKPDKVIYYCVDDFSEWPGMNKATIQRFEQQLLQQINAVICSSQTLFEKFQHQHPTHLLRHGVNVNLFSSTPHNEHPILASIPKPRVGYFGNFDERNDQNLIKAMAQSMPDVAFVFTGPVQDNISKLRNIPNVHFTGAIPYKELPALINGWEACLLPYHLNSLTVNINPLKLKEYLASGKPVIATPLPDVMEFSRYLRVVNQWDVTGWQNAIRDAIEGNWVPDLIDVGQMLAGESWHHKADIFLRLCQVA